MRSHRTRLLVRIALTAALSFVLGMFKLWEMPQGGSVSLEMLPIIVLAFVDGAGAAVVAGLLGGTLGAILRPEIVGWLQFVLDYPLAYGAVGLAGVFSGVWRRFAERSDWARGIALAIVPGVIVAAVVRFAVHVASGYFFFGQYAPEGQPVIVYSMLYNSFVFVAAALVLVASIAIIPVLSRAGIAKDGEA